MTAISIRRRHLAEPGSTALPVVPKVRRRRSLVVYICYLWLFILIFAAVFANVLPIAEYRVPVGAGKLKPSFHSLNLLLGTDSFGRSLLVRLIYGARVSLLVGTVSAIVGLTIGTVFGLLGGYLGRWVDWIITLITDAFLAFPPLILLLALASILKPSVTTLSVSLTLLTIPTFIRLTRANTIAWSSREFVKAAKNMGASNSRILLREILPNVLPSVAAFFPTVVAGLIVAEGSLSYLGLGLPSPRPSWGGMIADGQRLLTTDPQLVLIPAAVIFLTVFSLNQVGDHLRSRFDRTLQD
jgi:peptide/nickel transport system permease protein